MSADEASSSKTFVWKHSLMGCFDNFGMCITAFFIPCYTFGKSSEGLGKDCLVYGCMFMLPVIHVIVMLMQREEIREKRAIPGSLPIDLLVVMCCPFCSLVQQAQEVEHIRSEAQLRHTEELQEPAEEMKVARE